MRQPFWQFYQKCSTNTRFDKRAICKLCKGTFSFLSTSNNLKSHLRRLHPQESLSVGIVCNNKRPVKRPKNRKTTKSKIWKHFSVVLSEQHDNMAMCNVCQSIKCYDFDENKLSDHLAAAHPESYNQWLEEHTAEKDILNAEAQLQDNQDDTGTGDEDESKLEDVLWGYFEREGEGQARCVVCQDTLTDSREDLNRHMEEHHPKLIGHATGDEDQASEASNAADDDNTFTEVVYLEQDVLQDVGTHRTQKQRRSRDIPKPKTEHKTPKKRIRLSTSSDDYPIRKKERRDEPEEDELTIFLKYIKCLLQKLSKEAFSKVQVEIVNQIMNAQNSYVELQKANILSVNEINSGQNYSITVAPCTSRSEVTANSQTIS